MSKKSYKQLQNRLYREIKRRIIAEHRFPAVSVETFERPIQTFKTKYYADCRDMDLLLDPEVEHLLKTKLVTQMGQDLLEAGCFTFTTAAPGQSMHVPDRICIEISIDVALPKTRT